MSFSGAYIVTKKELKISMNRLCELQSQRQENLIFSCHNHSLPQVIKGNGAQTVFLHCQQSVIDMQSSGIISLSIFIKPFL